MNKTKFNVVAHIKAFNPEVMGYRIVDKTLCMNASKELAIAMLDNEIGQYRNMPKFKKEMSGCNNDVQMVEVSFMSKCDEPYGTRTHVTVVIE